MSALSGIRPGPAWSAVAGLALAMAIAATPVFAAGGTPAFAAGGTTGAPARVDAGLLARATADPTAKTSFFVLFDRQPAGAAPAAASRADRAGRVIADRRARAERSQAGVRLLLNRRGVPYTAYWIADTIRVTGDKALLDELAGRAEVREILPDRSYPLVQPVSTLDAPATGQGVEWNIDRIGAPKVWNAYGDRGEGVVVGTIDTGAQVDHPAIARQYRGATAGSSTPGNAHNWYDPAGVCPGPGPCDNVGHGTHVLGTILGDDGQGNQIGVAPKATWIAAKGCETTFCSLGSLLSAGQWMLAPTDASGNDPRPDLAPDVINNSWGGWPGDPFYQQIVGAWVAAGIVPVFAAGNNGRAGCASAGSPGDYADSYAVGAFDRNNAIADFSARGPGGFGGLVKPDVAAPGVDVRSSVPGGYATYSGTSMAAPHVTGTIALAISGVPALRGDIPAVLDLVNGTTVPMPDASCGGTDRDNNVWGHGRLDTFMVLAKAPRGPVGQVRGTVRAGGLPVAGAQVRVDSTVTRTATSDAQGGYAIGTLPAGRVTMTVTAFGYLGQSLTVPVQGGTSTTRDVTLTRAPRFVLSSRASDPVGRPLPGVLVSLPGTPLAPVVTDAAGAYRVADVPGGTYDVLFDGGGCYVPQRRSLTIASDVPLDVSLPYRSDGQAGTCPS